MEDGQGGRGRAGQWTVAGQGRARKVRGERSRQGGREVGRENTAKTPRQPSQYGGHNNAGHGVLTAIPMGCGSVGRCGCWWFGYGGCDGVVGKDCRSRGAVQFGSVLGVV